jgi:hypothetical protein
MFLLADAYQFEVPEPRECVPSLADIWILALADLDVDSLNAAFRKLLQTWKPDFGRKFPAPGDLRAFLDSARTTALTEEAERAWLTTLALIRVNYHPDIGWSGSEFTKQVENAILAAGGTRYLWNASAEQRIWAKKEFVASYLRFLQLQDNAPLLANEEPKVLGDGSGH